jgi:hypothetical protein
MQAVSVIRIWSSKGRSSNSPAFFSRSVNFQSDSLAWELPPGWLWARINDAAPEVRRTVEFLTGRGGPAQAGAF